MRVLQVSPALPVDVCHQAVSLSHRGWLEYLFTSTASNGRDLKGRFLNHWLGRREVRIKSNELRAIVASDVRQKLRLLTGRSQVESADERFSSVDIAASRHVDDELDAVICREDAALRTFQRACERKVLRIYDLPTAHYELTRRLMSDEIECFPELEADLAPSIEYAENRILHKDRELDLADWILCPSHFVKRSLLSGGYSEKSIHVLPFACEPRWLECSSRKRGNVVLAVGQISVRKGVHRLLKVWKEIGAYRTHTLRLIGDMRLPSEYISKYKGCYEHMHPLPRKELIHQYAAAKMFVSNPMSEGMSIVITEALSAGTPVVASRNSGAEEIITDNEEGVLVEYGDDDALAESIERLLMSPNLLSTMSEKAKDKARVHTWDGYSQKFIEWLEAVVTKARLSS